MSQKDQNLGDRGESLAADFLRQHDYAILGTNWHCPRGELDIIAQQGQVLVFVEVKTRRTRSTEAAFSAITPMKRERLIASAYTYIHEHQLDDTQWRIDVIAVALPKHGSPMIDHVENALDW